MIDPNSIEKLKATIDIVDVIGNYLELKKSGANYKCNCPFHGEKTPSFIVSPQKQIFHCFGCGIGGDAIKFVMEYEKLSYPEAVEKIASMYNITLHYTKGKSSYQEYKRILELLNHWYKQNLFKNQKALAYLNQRSVVQKSIEKFELGYAPSNNEVIEFLKLHQIPLPKAYEAGILAQSEDKRFYARLIDRITFPIYNSYGSLIGFGGRTLSNHPAKYINSPQTKLFDKSRVLYGYHLAKESIFKQQEIIICEGYMDVIMLHQANFTNAVATLGTALTSAHLPLLKKGEPKITLAYDGDSAGINAAFKAAKILSSSGFEGKVVLFPNNLDPADLVAKNDLQKLKELFQNGQDLVLFVLEQIKTNYNLNNPHQKQKALMEAKNYLKTLSAILQEAYAQKAAVIFNYNANFFTQQSNNFITNTSQIKKDIAWEMILKTLMQNPSLIDEVLNYLDFSFAREYEEAFKALANNNLEHPVLRGIAVDERVPTLNEEELKKQILQELILFYKQKLRNLTQNSTLDYKKKSFLIRKIKIDILPRLQKGELITYESDFTF